MADPRRAGFGRLDVYLPDDVLEQLEAYCKEHPDRVGDDSRADRQRREVPAKPGAVAAQMVTDALKEKSDTC